MVVLMWEQTCWGSEMELLHHETGCLCAVRESDPNGTTCTHDVSGAPLNVKTVEAARALEMEFFQKMRVYDIVSQAEARKSGKGKVIKGRWIDTNKGDTERPDYRSRFVGKEFNTGVDATLYAATPPLEALKLLITQVASMRRQGSHMVVSDVICAYFQAAARHNVEVPEEDSGYYPGALGASD